MQENKNANGAEEKPMAPIPEKVAERVEKVYSKLNEKKLDLSISSVYNNNDKKHNSSNISNSNNSNSNRKSSSRSTSHRDFGDDPHIYIYIHSIYMEISIHVVIHVGVCECLG